jgi:hypothetical protein
VRPRTALLSMIVGAALAGCSSGVPAPKPVPMESTTAPTTEPTTAPTTTQQHSNPVVTRDGACPYFSTDFAQQTVGQHLVRSTVTTTQPYHGCTLYRPDGAPAITVTVTIYATPLAAQEKAVSVLGAGANPTDVGDRGTVAIVADGAKLAASKGRYLLLVVINQQSSLQAHDLAAAVAAKIH